MDPAAPDPIKPLSSYTPQSDSSKFIRTYAKDFAALSGEQPQHPASPSRESIGADSGIALPEYDPSPVNRTEPASPQEFPQERVDLKESDSEGVFQTAPSAEPDRDAILARLRAKISAVRAVDATAPVIEPSLRTAAPDFASVPEPVLPIPQITKESVAPEPSLSSVQNIPSPLHTYSSDFADRIDTAGGTTFSVLAAQSDAAQTHASSVRKKRSIAPLLAGGAMLFIGVGAVAGAYYFTRQGSFLPAVASVPSLIPFDESVEVKGTGQTLMQAISNVAQGGSVSGNIVVTYVTQATSTGNGVPQAGGELIKQLGLSAPSILLRNIDDSSTVGVIRAGQESRPFMVLKVNSYERTFAGMLSWEPAMARDLAIFYPEYADAVTIRTTTSTSSPQFRTPVPAVFTDAVVNNYDVRILRDGAGRSLMLYGYKGKDVLIIARDEAAFTALVSRLQAAGN